MKNIFLISVLLFSLTAFTQDSLFSASDIPCNNCNEKDRPVEIGNVFRFAKAGSIAFIRHYKFSNDNSEYTVNIWSMSGQRLASQKYVAPGASGWQRVPLAMPLAVDSGTNYIVSVYTPSGQYSAKRFQFTSDITKGNVTGPASASVGGNGRYSYDAVSSFPDSTWSSAWYFIDPVFQPLPIVTPPPASFTVSAGRDTSLVLSPEPGPFFNYQLQGSIGGDGVTYEWAVDVYDTVYHYTQLNPLIRFDRQGVFYPTLTATDKSGNTISKTISIVVKGNPKDVILELLRDGTYRIKGGNIYFSDQ